MTDDFTVAGLDHVSITAPEELQDDVIEWYGSCLGLEHIEKTHGARTAGAWFRVGNVQLHLALDEHNPPKYAHFGIVVDDFDAAVGRLRAWKCHIEQARPIAGLRRCFTRDPAGNRIEIMARAGQ